jgi:hypothetical protein
MLKVVTAIHAPSASSHATVTVSSIAPWPVFASTWRSVWPSANAAVFGGVQAETGAATRERRECLEHSPICRRQFRSGYPRLGSARLRFFDVYDTYVSGEDPPRPRKDLPVHTPALAHDDGHRVHTPVLPRRKKFGHLQGRSSPVWALGRGGAPSVLPRGQPDLRRKARSWGQRLASASAFASGVLPSRLLRVGLSPVVNGS